MGSSLLFCQLRGQDVGSVYSVVIGENGNGPRYQVEAVVLNASKGCLFMGLLWTSGFIDQRQRQRWQKALNAHIITTSTN